jgi:hypothetical protein
MFEVTIGAEFMLFAGYLLYGILRKHSSVDDRPSISFYIMILIGFITSVLVLNVILSLSRFLQEELLLVKGLLTSDIILLVAVVGDVLRLNQARSELPESQDA